MANQNISFIEARKQINNFGKSTFANKTKIGLKTCTCQCTCQVTANRSGVKPNPKTPILEDLNFLTPLPPTPSPRKGGGGILNSPEYMKHVGKISLDDMSLPRTPGQDINLGASSSKRERSLEGLDFKINQPNKTRRDGRRH